MKFDSKNLPAEVWHFTMANLRKGVGIRRVEPRDVHDVGYGRDRRAISARGLGQARLYTDDCYPTREEAERVAREELARVRRAEILKHEHALSTIDFALKALEA